MKLLTNEAEFFEWMSDAAGVFDTAEDPLRQYAPNQYPCYCFWEDIPHEVPVLRYLYESDCEMMLSEIRKHTREND